MPDHPAQPSEPAYCETGHPDLRRTCGLARCYWTAAQYPRPINYALSRVAPPRGVATGPRKRFVVVVDPGAARRDDTLAQPVSEDDRGAPAETIRRPRAAYEMRQRESLVVGRSSRP
jgi:hypothetical protein